MAARWRIAALVTVGIAAGAFAGRKVAHGRGAVVAPVSPVVVSSPAMASHGARLVAPHAKTPVTVDGEQDEPAWSEGNIGRTGDYGKRPYSDARAVWRDGMLYLVLYASDEDIKTTTARHDEPLWLADSVRLVWKSGDTEHVIEISPAGIVTDMERKSGGGIDLRWESGAKVSLDLDGTLNQSNDNDEEWVVEMSIPLASLGLTGKPGETLGLTIERCDLSRDVKKRSCATWGANGGELVLGD